MLLIIYFVDIHDCPGGYVPTIMIVVKPEQIRNNNMVINKYTWIMIIDISIDI